MIVKTVGLKRLFVLAVLLALNIVLASIYFMVVDPMLQDARQRQSTLGSEISDLNSKIATAKQEIAFLKENLDSYRVLEERGFFTEQDRFMIGRLIDETGRKAGLSQFNYSIDELKKIDNEDAKKIDHQLVSSRITVKSINASLDNGVYALMQDIGSAFPEHTRINKFEIKRARLLDDQALKDIASGNASAGLITAEVVFEWMSLVSNAPPVNPNAPAGTAAPSTGVPAPVVPAPPSTAVEGF